VRIKQQEEKITRLTRKLEKRPARSLAKSSESEEEEKAFIQMKLPTRRFTQKGAVHLRMVDLQA